MKDLIKERLQKLLALINALAEELKESEVSDINTKSTEMNLREVVIPQLIDLIVLIDKVDFSKKEEVSKIKEKLKQGVFYFNLFKLFENNHDKISAAWNEFLGWLNDLQP